MNVETGSNSLAIPGDAVIGLPPSGYGFFICAEGV
jgi:hypothetical protein